MPPTLMSLSVVVSGGGSAATDLACTPRSPAVPTSVNPPQEPPPAEPASVLGPHENLPSPDAGQCDTETAGQWTLLPSHEQAQHLTPGLSCCRKRERGRGRVDRERGHCCLFSRSLSKLLVSLSISSSFPVDDIHSGQVCVPLAPFAFQMSSACHPSPCHGFSPSPTTTMAP